MNTSLLDAPPPPSTFDGPPAVEIFFPEQPFGGVQVFMPGEVPTQVQINTGSPVNSVFGRTGAITAQAGDYAAFYQPLGQSANLVNTVFGRSGNVNALSGDYASFYPLLSGSYSNPTWIASLDYSKITNAPAVPVTSVFGRTGAITALAGDYSAFYQAVGSYATLGANTFTAGQTMPSLSLGSPVPVYIGPFPAQTSYSGIWFTTAALASSTNYAFLATGTATTIFNAGTDLQFRAGNVTLLDLNATGDTSAFGYNAAAIANQTLTVTNANPTYKAFVVKANSTSDTGNLQEWQNNTGTALSSISPTGVFTGSGAGLTAIPWTALTGVPAFEPALGNPATNGYILSSTTAGVRSWIAPPSGGAGTVTSVAVTGANGIGVTGSPITGAGTIALSLPITLAGTAGQTLTLNQSVTLGGVAGSSINFGNGGVIAYVGVANAWTVGQVFKADTAAHHALVAMAAATPTATIQEWQNSAGTALCSVSAAGVFTGSGAGLTALPWASITGAPAFITQANAEPPLGNPAANGYVLSSTTAGVRSWVAQAGATSQGAPTTPTGTTSTTGVMMGLAGTITPATSGKIVFTIIGTATNSSSTGGGKYQLRYGTGTAPANAAALTGTAVGGIPQFTVTVVNQFFPIATTVVVTGLTVGTAYWFDLAQYAVTGGTATATNVATTAFEIL